MAQEIKTENIKRSIDLQYDKGSTYLTFSHIWISWRIQIWRKHHILCEARTLSIDSNYLL